MKHFVQYHNSEKMGYSISAMSEPHIFTDKSVKYLPSNTVWLISGEGKSPKTFYLAAAFKPHRTTSGTYDHPDFKNAAYGVGRIFGESIQLNGLPWFEALKADQQNFRNGLFEITDSNIIEALTKLASAHTL
jgi:hypothetical protein